MLWFGLGRGHGLLPSQAHLRCKVLPLLLIPVLFNLVEAQGIRTSPYSSPSMLKGLSTGGLDLAPSNPLGLPGSSGPGAGGSGSLYLSEEMLRGILPLIPNLQFGYLYDFGNHKVSYRTFHCGLSVALQLEPGFYDIRGSPHRVPGFLENPDIHI